MGLDMYLTRHIWIGGEYEHRHVTGTVDLDIGVEPLSIAPENISQIISRVGYWRKANQIHAWFVREVQDGVDECQETPVSWETLQELKALCEKALETKDATLLPPHEGFFFGVTEINKGYWEDITYTVDILSKLDDVDGDYYYHSSW